MAAIRQVKSGIKIRLSVLVSLLLFSASLLVSCSKDDKGAKVEQRARNTFSSGDMQDFEAHMQGRRWAGIFGQSDETFRTQVANFNGVTTENVGYITATPDAYEAGDVGAWLRAAITVSGGFNSSNYQRRSISGNGYLQMEFYDDYAVSGDENGITYDPFIVRFKGGASGYVENGRFNLTFTDSYGTVVITGQYSGNVVRGQIQYNNNSELGSYSGTLGQFQTYTCDFFICN